MDIKIKVNNFWHAEDVRDFCIRHNYYTAGGTRAYEAMLNHVEGYDPTPENIYIIAKDITEHSNNLSYDYQNEEEAILHIMYQLNKETVSTFFNIEDRY